MSVSNLAPLFFFFFFWVRPDTINRLVVRIDFESYHVSFLSSDSWDPSSLDEHSARSKYSMSHRIPLALMLMVIIIWDIRSECDPMTDDTSSIDVDDDDDHRHTLAHTPPLIHR